MRLWIFAALLGSVLALLLYGWRGGGLPGRIAALALLRAVALTTLGALILNAPAGMRRAPAPLVALDVSASWLRGGDSARWRAARARARTLARDSLLLVGDSVRAGPAPSAPDDHASRAAPLVERALGAGRPLVLVTDGELDDPAVLRQLPAGSRLDVVAAPPRTDRAVVSLEAPRAAEAGDTIAVRVMVRAGGAGAPAGALRLVLDGREAARAALPPLGALGEMTVALSLPIPTDSGTAVLAAVVRTPGDVEPRNDTLAAPLEIARAAGAVLVSSAPDYDLRFVLPVLRGALALPVRAYYRVAPGQWRREGTLTSVPEGEVRAALRAAPLAMLHGDTALFGPPRGATAGSLLLYAPPPASEDEWYPVAAPPSPLAPALALVPWDSLPPLDAAARMPAAGWIGLEVARGRGGDRRPVVVGSEQPRRVVVVGAAGLWRWAFRGGAGADAYAALWGSIFDWLAAERRDMRAAVPADPMLRAGEPVRWRRGQGADSLVTLLLRRRGAPAPDTLALRFGGSAEVETPPLAPGVYDARAAGGTAVLVVNASRELLPRAALSPRAVAGGAPLRADARRLRDAGWPYLVIVLALCAEWLLRRRAGLR